MLQLIDLIGQRFGKWLVLKRANSSRAGQARWLCRCDCGREQIVQGGNLRNGTSGGCRSCHISGKNTKHGQKGTRLYQTWQDIIRRCENPAREDFKYYGGRGIAVCSEWRKDFMVFRRWVLSHGYKESLTIDRINNDENYEPENCQFITQSENSLKAWHVDNSYAERHLEVKNANH